MELIKIGKLTASHGIKGEVKVKSDSTLISKNYKGFIYIKIKEQIIPMKIESVKGSEDKKIVKFDYFNSLTEVENLKNIDLFVEEKDLPQLEEDEFYIKDLIGLPVFVSEEVVGEVVGVRDYPQSHYLEIQTEKGLRLIPFINEFVLEVSDRIVVKDIEGLL